ncbi:MAG: hypothetical protein ACRENB_10970 [Gemmatimonadales bacterium]
MTRVPAGILLFAASAACSRASKPAAPAAPAGLCVRWRVTVDNEFPFPVRVFLYTERSREALGAVFPGVSDLWAPDSGMVTFEPPLGQSLIARGRQIRATVRCLERAPAR